MSKIRIGDTGSFTANSNGKVYPVIVEKILNANTIYVRNINDCCHHGTLAIKHFVPDPIKERVELEPAWDE